MRSLIEDLTEKVATRRSSKLDLPDRRPPPRRPRELFDVIAELGNKANVEHMMATFIWKEEVDPRDMVFAVLGRLPYQKELDDLPAEYSPRGHMRRLLVSPEFRLRLIRRLVDSYAERQRLCFVRVPRACGTALQRALSLQAPRIAMELADPLQVDDEDMIAALGKMLGAVRNTRAILLADRTPLRAFLHSPLQKNDARGGIMRAWEFDAPAYRRGDMLFTVVRDPEEILLSQINMTLRERKVGGRRPVPGSPEIIEEGGKILAALASNPICRALGEGNARTTLPMLRVSNIEITDISRYERWARQTFSIETPQRRLSVPLFGREHLSEAQAQVLRTKTVEDRVVYDRIRAALEATKESSVFGASI